MVQESRKQQIRQRCETRAKARAQTVGACAWYECAIDILNTEEYHEVQMVWSTMNGSSCWNDAFHKWFNSLTD